MSAQPSFQCLPPALDDLDVSFTEGGLMLDTWLGPLPSSTKGSAPGSSNHIESIWRVETRTNPPPPKRVVYTAPPDDLYFPSNNHPKWVVEKINLP